MKWYDANKQKPRPGTTVLIHPVRRMKTAYWDGEKWLNPLYPLPAFPYTMNGIEKWAYIKYPKKSWWKRIWKK